MTLDLSRSDALPDWVSRLPDWVRPDEVRWLSRRPWITGFIHADDYSIDPAVERFDRSQRRFVRAADRAGGELVSVRGLETTSLRFSTGTARVVRSVTVTSTDPDCIRGIAVPYGQPSTPVEVAGIVTLEQFDRHSLAPLPPSVPLRADHDLAQSLGRATSLRHTEQGLAVEAPLNEDGRLVWVHRWLRGEYSSLSIAFAGSPVFDQWSTWRGLPLRIVRGGRLVEVSVVEAPAYETARITEVFARR